MARRAAKLRVPKLATGYRGQTFVRADESIKSTLCLVNSAQVNPRGRRSTRLYGDFGDISLRDSRATESTICFERIRDVWMPSDPDISSTTSPDRFRQSHSAGCRYYNTTRSCQMSRFPYVYQQSFCLQFRSRHSKRALRSDGQLCSTSLCTCRPQSASQQSWGCYHGSARAPAGLRARPGPTMPSCCCYLRAASC